MRLFTQVFCYAVGAAMIVAGLGVVAFVGYQLASVVDAPEQLALAWITSALLFSILGVLLVAVGLALGATERPRESERQRIKSQWDR